MGDDARQQEMEELRRKVRLLEDETAYNGKHKHNDMDEDSLYLNI
jgi:hypothetical protein